MPIIDFTVASGIDDIDIAETLNCTPQNFPKATDVPSKFLYGIFSFSANPDSADFDTTTSFAFEAFAATCFCPKEQLPSFMESFSVFSKRAFLEYPTKLNDVNL